MKLKQALRKYICKMSYADEMEPLQVIDVTFAIAMTPFFGLGFFLSQPFRLLTKWLNS